MKKYELMFVLPGTLAENETAPIVEKVKQLLTDCQSQDLVIKTEGKSRLAYPIRHIRYGYFYLAFFLAESTQVKEMESKLRLMPELLRALITVKSPKAVVNKINFANVLYAQVDERTGEPATSSNFTHRREERKVERVKTAVETQSIASVPTIPEETYVENEVETQSIASVPETPDLVSAPVVAVPEKPIRRRRKTAEKVSLDDIDKKLDEILDIDLGKV